MNDCVNSLIELLEALEAPKVFAVRLLNPAHPEFKEVDEFFDMVVKPVVEGEMGFKLTVIDQKHQRDAARVDQEIFEKLHRSSVVIADITGERPNCYVELGYALGRALPTILTVKDGVVHPFDITTYSAHHWKTDGTPDERRRVFREHWNASKSRPSLVSSEPLIP